MPARVGDMVKVGELVTSLALVSATWVMVAKTEIENLDDALRRDFDIGGLQIAMDDSFFVRGFQGVGDLFGVVERGIEGHGACFDKESRDFRRRPVP